MYIPRALLHCLVQYVPSRSWRHRVCCFSSTARLHRSVWRRSHKVAATLSTEYMKKRISKRSIMSLQDWDMITDLPLSDFTSKLRMRGFVTQQLVNMASKPVPVVSQGGFVNSPKATYSKETQQLLKCNPTCDWSSLAIDLLLLVTVTFLACSDDAGVETNDFTKKKDQPICQQ